MTAGDESSHYHLSERATVALRSALQGQIRHPYEEYSLRRALRSLCVEAHRRGLSAENLILLFKRAWQTLPESRTTDARRKPETLDRLITICIEEFYAVGRISDSPVSLPARSAGRAD